MSTTSHPEAQDAEVRSYKDQYPVRRHDDVYRYRVTIPRQMFDDAEVNDRDRLGVKLDHEGGRAVIVYTTDLDDAELLFSASKHSSGELSIPSALGAALDIEDTKVEWERIDREDGHFEFRAKTEAHLPQVDTSQALPLESKPLKHVSQAVEHKGKEWEQEHFQLYLTVDNVEKLDWGDGASIGITIVRVNNVPSIRLTKSTQGLHPKSIKTVRTTGDNQRDRILYVPNDIVRSLSLVEQELAWVAQDGNLVLVPLN
jgi:hypothetical protein